MLHNGNISGELCFYASHFRGSSDVSSTRFSSIIKSKSMHRTPIRAMRRITMFNITTRIRAGGNSSFYTKENKEKTKKKYRTIENEICLLFTSNNSIIPVRQLVPIVFINFAKRLSCVGDSDERESVPVDETLIFRRVPD